MIGEQYWSTGITLKWNGRGSWWAVVDFYDDGFAQDGSTEGQLRVRYAEPIQQAIDTILADAKKIGVQFKDRANLYIEGDGEDPDEPLPDNWREIIAEQAERLGWYNLYTQVTAAAE